jgi:hypothetical protein
VLYLPVAIVKKRLGLKASLHGMLQIPSLTLFEKTPLLQLFTGTPLPVSPSQAGNQLNLFN